MHEIFKYFISKEPTDDNKRLAFMSWFISSFPEQEFRREEAVFYDFMSYAAKLSLPLKYKYLEVYLDTEVKHYLVKSKTKVTGTESLSYDEPASLETAVGVTRDVLKEHFNLLADTEAPVEDFAISTKSFMKERQNQRLIEVFEKAYSIVSSKDSTEEALEYARDEIVALGDIYDVENLDELVESIGTAVDDASMQFLCDTGLVSLDKVLGGLRRKQVMGVEAPPGHGKTRFVLGVLVHRALVVYHLNVIYFALEQSKSEIEAMLVSRHVFELYSKIVTDRMITEGKVPADLQPLVNAAKLDLFESGKYGKISIIPTNLYVEDFVEKMRNQNRLHGPYDLFVIDHMYLVESSSTGYGRLTEAQIIQKSYRKFKRFVRANNVGGIAINQFNATGVEASKLDKTIDATMIAGGIEAYRNTDMDIAITATDVMLAQQARRVHIPKSRSSEPFSPTIISTRLGCCYWYQQVKRTI